VKVAAAYIVHYGKTYLRESIAACAPCVDQFFALYAPEGSQGHRSKVRCPEREEELRACFDSVSDRLTWVRGNWGSECEHRNAGHAMATEAGADLILQHDCDEIWHPENLRDAIQQAHDGTAARYAIAGFVHHWRSLHWIAEDVWQPIRILKPIGQGEGQQTLNARIHHMAYAQGEAIVRYKFEVSGHRNEIRPRWFEGIFMAWPERKTDLHPVVSAWWDAKEFNTSLLPDCLRAHPNFGKEIIR
jgi:hypothetical protein